MQVSTLKGVSEFIRTGKTPPTKESKYFNGDIQWYTPGDLDKKKYLDKSTRNLTQLSFTDKKAVQFPAGTLLVACIGDIGKLGVTTKNCSSNQQITGIKPNINVDVNYLYYWFRKNKNLIQHFANNAVVPIINNGTLEKIKIPLPPLPEQQKIAAILDAADKLRQKDQQLIEQYNALSQSLFLDMFGDPVTNPVGWDKLTLDTLGKISSGSTPRRDDKENYQGNIPWIKTAEVNGRIITEAAEYISESALKNSSCKLNPAGSLIIAMYGQGKTRGQVGILGIEAATNQACAVIPPTEIIDFSYLFVLMKLLYKDLRQLGRGGNQPNLNCGLIKSYSIISPPITLQNQFAERIQAIEAQKQQAQASLKKSDDLFNSLLQRAFKGELTEFSGDEAPASSHL